MKKHKFDWQGVVAGILPFIELFPLLFYSFKSKDDMNTAALILSFFAFIGLFLTNVALFVYVPKLIRYLRSRHEKT